MYYYLTKLSTIKEQIMFNYIEYTSETRVFQKYLFEVFNFLNYFCFFYLV